MPSPSLLGGSGRSSSLPLLLLLIGQVLERGEIVNQSSIEKWTGHPLDHPSKQSSSQSANLLLEVHLVALFDQFARIRCAAPPAHLFTRL